ncbi:MAG: hypothetical protein AB7Y46_16815 [Armatimonadota bacterium]
MALYSGAQYRMGFQGYMAWKLQTGHLVAPDATADPAPAADVNNVLGFFELPSRNYSEGLQQIDSAGFMRMVAEVAGRREASVGTRVYVADGTFLQYAVRNHADPDAPGTEKGLQLLTLEYGSLAEFGAAQAWADQGLDTLFNSLRIDYAEGQPLVATLDLWPTVVLRDVTARTSAVDPTTPVLHWVHCHWDVLGTDYHPIWAGTNIAISNGCDRHGCRQQFGAIGAELNISRTPYRIMPGLETLQVSHRWRDKLPSALRNTDDWGTLTLRAEQPGTGAGRRYFEVTIDHNYLNQDTGQQARAGQPQMWSTNTLSRAITITSGLT